MRFRGTLRTLALSALVVGAGTLTGCVVNGGGYADDDGYYEDSRGYPPANPRNGYRYAYPSGPSLIFDSGLGMYSVYGQPDYYYHGGYFYRWNSGNWNRSRYWNRRWERCDSRYWPRPIQHVHKNYYGHGKRPRHDWDRDDRRDRDGRGDRDWRGDRDGRDGRDWRGDRDDRDGRGDRPGEQHGGRPTPGGGLDGRGDDHGGRDDHRDDGDANGDGVRERGERYMRGGDQGARDAQRRRELDQEIRDRSRERDPVDHRRQPDENAQRRVEDPRRTRDAMMREQAERNAAQRGAAEQRERERGERQAAEQAARAQRRDADRQREEAREEAGNDDAERSPRGGERGDNWEARGDRR